MANFVEHIACDSCGSSDGNALYDDGSAFCFACETPSRPGGSQAGTAEAGGSSPASQRSGFLRGRAQALAKRGLTEETCKKFGYIVADWRGSKVQVAPLYRDGELVAQKIRTRDKSFPILGDSKKLPLFGMNLWRDHGKRLVVTEGEIDCMSVSQAQQNKWPVVSVPNGASEAHKAIARHIEWVDGFDEVIFAFDADQPGQEAAKRCASLLPPGKAKIAVWPEGIKDANDLLKAGRSKEIIDCMWGAKDYRPDGVVAGTDLVADAIVKIERGTAWPWEPLTEFTYGIRRKELYGFGGGTGCGKSTIFKQVALHQLDQGFPVGMLMLEEPPAHTLRTMGGMKIGARVHVPDVEYDTADLEAACNYIGGGTHFYDHFGSSGWEAIKEKIRFMVHGCGIKDIFLDHLTALAASITDLDERKAIDKIMAELSSLTQELDCTIYFISHLSTPEGKPHEEGGRVLEKHFRGSRAIGYWSHFLFGIERDKQEVGGVTTFRVLKDRYTGDSTGLTFGLRYSKETGLLEECELDSGGEEAEQAFATDY